MIFVLRLGADAGKPGRRRGKYFAEGQGEVAEYEPPVAEDAAVLRPASSRARMDG